MDIELLAPAGGEQSAVAALTAGADAVYLGLKSFSARSEAENFDEDALVRTVRLAHLLGAKVYVALNTLVKDRELDDFFTSARRVWNAGADALLIQDIFLGRELKACYPEMTLHLSTQAGCCNVFGASLAKDFGFSRVVLARETPIADMGAISKVIETEAFVQGALCTAFSGQCYLSSFAGNNSGNRGRCKQPCRKRYSIDRAGYEPLAYALSTSDLCVGPEIGKLADAGVTSLKIEGRMRRPEYVAAAVKYYRALLDGKPSDAAFEMLRRAYNRGDYTRGLGFGQKKDFLSRGVQGHIGERIGAVTFRHGVPVCRTNYQADGGDGLKILRSGREVGGAVFGEKTADGYAVLSRETLAEGDEVRLTTSVASNAAALVPVKFRKLSLKLTFLAGEPPVAQCAELRFRGDVPLARAQTAPLAADDLAACFQKTDGLPLEVCCEVVTDGVFLPKSALNAFRRDFYAALLRTLCPARPPLAEVKREIGAPNPVKGRMTAVISDEPQRADLFIYKPRDYQNFKRPSDMVPAGEVYLYLPPFLTAADEAALRDRIREFDGVYTDGYYGIALAKKYGVRLFAGTGFHLTNRISVGAIPEFAQYFALSDEISTAEQDALAVSGAFALTDGDIRVMDLIYCPFERTCASCDRRKFYRMTDEDGRVFPLLRYRISDMGCRFEVYNCATLRTDGGLCSRLTDQSAAPVRSQNTTKGHAGRSML